MDTVELVSDPSRAAVLMEPLRRGLLQALLERPDSAAGLGLRLGLTRQRLNYHLREMERAGLVELVEERRKGNCVERILRPTARYFVIDPSTAMAPDPETTADRFSATYLTALAVRTVREVGTAAAGARRAGKRLATAAIEAEVRLARPADLQAFVDDLALAVTRTVERHHRDDPSQGRPFRLVLGIHPRPPRPVGAKGDAADTGHQEER